MPKRLAAQQSDPHGERGGHDDPKMVIVYGLWRVSGSTNWSTTGQTLRDNELTIIRDAIVCSEAPDAGHRARLSPQKDGRSPLETLTKPPSRSPAQAKPSVMTLFLWAAFTVP